MHLAGSQAIPPLFANFIHKKTQVSHLLRHAENHPPSPGTAGKLDKGRAIANLKANPLKQHALNSLARTGPKNGLIRAKSRPRPQTSF
jgi:hypothetical protein